MGLMFSMDGVNRIFGDMKIFAGLDTNALVKAVDTNGIGGMPIVPPPVQLADLMKTSESNLPVKNPRSDIENNDPKPDFSAPRKWYEHPLVLYPLAVTVMIIVTPAWLFNRGLIYIIRSDIINIERKTPGSKR